MIYANHSLKLTYTGGDTRIKGYEKKIFMGNNSLGEEFVKLE